MEELSTPVDTVVEDTSVTNEPATETVADTSAENVTEPTTTTEETAETTTETVDQETVADEPKLYAGKYKSIEDLEKGYKEAEKSFNRVAELEKQIKAYEQQKPKYVNEQGKINPEIKAKYDAEIDDQEFRTYVELSRSLDINARGEVERLLGEAQRLYNPKNKQSYINKLNEAKNYFNSDVIETIAKNKLDLESKYANEMKSYEQKARQEKANYFASEIQKTPELYTLVNPDSAEYSPEVFGIVKSMFDAYNGIDIQQTMNAINKIKELGVKQYKAQQEFESKKAQASVDTGKTVTTQQSSLPTGNEIRENPDLYDKAYSSLLKKGLNSQQAMARLDEIIMKG